MRKKLLNKSIMVLVLSLIIITSVLGILLVGANANITQEPPVYYPFKANLHTHTTQSDGVLSPLEIVTRYNDLGYDILALSDHSTVTYPWTDFGIGEINIASIASMEAEGIVAHIGVFFNTDVPVFGMPGDILTANQKNGGLAVLNHPGRYYSPNKCKPYIDLYRNHPNLIAMEIVNKNNRYKQDRVIWDTILTELMPERNIYCVASDDAHREGDIGWSYTVFWAEDTSEASIRDAMLNGRMYAVSRGTVENPTGEPPEITSVKLVNGIATIVGANYDRVSWISCGEEVGGEESQSTQGLTKYIRAELIGKGGIAYSQPIALY